MPGVTHRRFSRYSPPLNVNSLAGYEPLYESLWELEQLYDLLPVGLATLDLNLHVLRVNPVFAEWAGGSASELVGRSFSEIFPTLSSTLTPLMTQVIQTGAPSCSITFSGAGTPEERRMTYFPWRDKKKQIQGLFLRADKSRGEELQRARAEEERYRQGLAHMQRVSTLAELASSLAHELNQPLTAILSNAQAALRFVSSDAPVLEYVRDILKDIVADDKRASEVIRRLRLLLRKNDLEYTALSVNAVVEDVYRILRSDAVMRRSTIQLDLAPELPLVHGDAVQLQQVFLNLMLNGLEAMSTESPTRRLLLVNTRRVSADLVQISVQDGGHGLDRDNLEHVFEPFYTTKSEGLGMGLSISRSIIQAHKGQLWAESNPERGATFHVTLPINASRSGGNPA